jgi:hypothetical protein
MEHKLNKISYKESGRHKNRVLNGTDEESVSSEFSTRYVYYKVLLQLDGCIILCVGNLADEKF